MSQPNTIIKEYLRELEAEARATRECLQQVPMDKSEYVPHEKSMQLGYMAALVGDMPRWIQHMIEKGTIDLEKYHQEKPETAEELTTIFDRNMDGVRTALNSVSDSDLSKEFTLKMGEQILLKEPLGHSISETINHMVHHRGQLTVYLRLNGRPVPSIYGPSADTRSF